MNLNVGKTKTMIVYRSSTMHPHAVTPLTSGGTLMEKNDFVVFGSVIFNSKMISNKTLETCSVSRATSQRLVILRMS